MQGESVGRKFVGQRATSDLSYGFDKSLDLEGFEADVNSCDCTEFTDCGFSQFMDVKAIRK